MSKKQFKFTQIPQQDIVKTQKDVNELREDLAYVKHNINIKELGNNYMNDFKTLVADGNCTIFFPKGTYDFGTNQIWLNSNVTIKGEDGTIFITTLPLDVENKAKPIFIADRKSNIKIHDIEVKNISNYSILLLVKTCNNVDVYNIVSTNVAVLHTTTYLNISRWAGITYDWAANTNIVLNEKRNANGNIYQCTEAGITGTVAPSHTSGTALDGAVTWTYLSPYQPELVDPSAVAGYISEDFGCKNINVWKCKITIDINVVNTLHASIMFSFCVDVNCYNNVIDGGMHGIMYWGGDAYYERGGYLQHPRWARRIDIYSNKVTNQAMGGIWGSKGEDINIYGNKVYTCKDVGIDMEGTMSGIISGNTVKNCTLGCITTYFFCKDILIDGNTVSLDNTIFLSDNVTPATKLYYHSNGINSTTNGAYDITISNNKFKYHGVEKTWGQIQPTNIIDFNFKNNELENVWINQSNSNAGKRKIIGNKFLFTYTSWALSPGIFMQNTHGTNILLNPACIIEDNEIITTAIQDKAGIAGILVEQSNYNGVTVTEINNNKVYGFIDSIRVVDSGTNVGRAQVFNIKDNIVTGNIVDSTTNYPLKCDWWLENNKTHLGVPVPNTIPNNKSFRVNQVIKYIATAGSNIGVVCTTAGVTNNTVWTATTSYTIGTRVNANGKVYQCTVAGTSSSIAPSHVSGTATDGTVTWAYVGTLAVFKNYGNISA